MSFTKADIPELMWFVGLKYFMKDCEVSRKLYHHVSLLEIFILMRIIKDRIIRSYLIVMHASETLHSENKK